MKERPILFSSAMILALLENRKFQTRRAVRGAENFPNITKFEPWINHEGEREYREGSGLPMWVSEEKDGTSRGWGCGFGEAGDRLWVRESWAIADDAQGNQRFYYKADGKPSDLFDPKGFKWKSSIHMPRVVSRITLELTNIRVERLQDISAADAIAEGISPEAKDPIESFKALWQSIHGPDSWQQNPWVWVVQFSVLQLQDSTDKWLTKNPWGMKLLTQKNI